MTSGSEQHPLQGRLKQTVGEEFSILIYYLSVVNNKSKVTSVCSPAQTVAAMFTCLFMSVMHAPAQPAAATTRHRSTFAGVL